MKARMLAILVAGVLAGWTLPGRAQDKGPLPPEQLPPPAPKQPETLPPPVVKVPPAPTPELPCGERVIWMDYFVPAQTLFAREHVRIEKVPTFRVDMRPEKRTFPTTVIEPREETRDVTVCTTEPVTTIDPATGKETTCMQQVTRTKQVKEVVFVAVPKVETVEVLVPRLVPAVDEVKHVYTLYEWHTGVVKKGCAISVPGAEVTPIRQCVVAPKPACLD